MYDNFWDYPFTTSNGLRSNRILDVLFNTNDRRVYARTPEGYDVYDRGFEYWQPAMESQFTGRRQPNSVEMQNFHRQRDYRFPSYYRPAVSELPNFFTEIEYLYRPGGEILDEENRVFHITTGIVDPWYRLWLGTNGLGVGIGDLDNLSLSIVKRSLPNIFPRDLLFDKSLIWIGGLSGKNIPSGITYWNLKTDTWTYIEDEFEYDLYNDDVRVIDKLNDWIYFGTELGISLHHPARKKWRSFTIAHGLESNRIHDLHPYAGMMFIGTEEGLNWYDPGTGNINESRDTRLDNIPVHKIVLLDSMHLLLATRDGLFKYNFENDRFSFFKTGSSLLDVRITSLAINNDTLWIANEYGIAMSDLKTGTWHSFLQATSRLQGSIHDINFTRNNVWFATDSGLLKYDKKRDYWYLYTTEDGLSHNRIFHIDIDGDDLWLSTSAGITIFRWNRPYRLE